ncbi:hypothetical protein 8G_00031 [Ralstonia phage Hyacinthe]|uniref:DUF4376 domain-containing protein n=3 Tax=Rahariannevirus raharianne TaxID=2846050 RepID=A0A7G5BBE6_9CAUD|nr:hypothetical protein KMC43_gp50 [Ralstonia phage Raharianne]QMV32425.1 hypothetical protein U2_00050 [Ralstonia phage Albius]QMV33463.1 hypothetical protein 8G_00031 [Ralstonia phage Hyacinthe]QMV33619.1 hypothetical protein Y2_00050 [Ralstonia phage Raharianne]
MTMIYVQFSDSSQTAVVGVFASPQNANVYANQAQIDDSDPRYLAFVNPSSTLTGAQVAQIAIIEIAYQAAIQQPVNYMGTTFQADNDSQAVLAKSLAAGSVPTGFFWLDKNNAQVSMTFAQLQGLAGAMLAQGQAAFAKKTGLKQQIRGATTVAAVRAINW